MHLAIFPFIVISIGLWGCNLYDSKPKPETKIAFMSLNVGDTWRYHAVQGWRNHSMGGHDSSLLTIRFIERIDLEQDTSYYFELTDSCIFRSNLSSGSRPVQVDTMKFPLSQDSISLYNRPPANVIYPPVVYYEFFLKEKIRLDTTKRAKNAKGEWVDSALIGQSFVNGSPLHVFRPIDSELVFLEKIGLYYHYKRLSGSATSLSYFHMKLFEWNGQKIIVD